MIRRIPLLLVLLVPTALWAADPIRGKVLGASGEPVEGARVTLIWGGETAVNSVAWVREGHLTNVIRDNKRRDRDGMETTTDGDGRFELADPERGWVLLVCDDSGWNELTPSELDVAEEIMLRPWARVGGTLHIAGEPAGERDFAFVERREFGQDGERTDGRGWFRISYQMIGKTAADGTFAFDRTMPGVYTGGISHRNGPAHLHEIPLATNRDPIVVREGDDLRILPGLVTQTVAGTLSAPEDAQADWSRADVYVFPQGAYEDPPPGGRAHCGMPYVRHWGYLDFFKTEESEAFRAGLRGVSPGGAFRIAGLPPESYELQAYLRDANGDVVLGTTRTFVIAPAFDDSARPALELGAIELEPATLREPVRDFLDTYVPAK